MSENNVNALTPLLTISSCQRNRLEKHKLLKYFGNWNCSKFLMEFRFFISSDRFIFFLPKIGKVDQRSLTSDMQ